MTNKTIIWVCDSCGQERKSISRKFGYCSKCDFYTLVGDE